MKSGYRETEGGFTLVELIIIIVVIVVLVTLSAFGITRYFADARDQQRNANSMALSEKLEAYYLNNGEYPSIPAVASDKGANPAGVTSMLNIDAAMLKMPNSTNTLAVVSPESTAYGTDDVIVYEASSMSSVSSCLAAANGACDLYVLRYQTEDGTERLIYSRRSNQNAATVSNPPVKPIVEVGQNETFVEAESSNPNCSTEGNPLTAKYRFRYQVNSRGWTLENWQPSSTLKVPGVEGAVYNVQAMTRCDDGTTVGAESPLSDNVSYTFPIGAPAAPVATVALNSNSRVQATSSVVTCDTGLTTQYAWRTRVNGGSWTSYTGFSTTRTSNEVTPVAGYAYGYTFQARCYNTGTAIASGASSSAEKTYIHPISTPATPTTSVTLISGPKVQAAVTAITCDSGTTAQYAWRTRTNGGTWGAYSSYSTTRTVASVTPAQGVKYSYNFAARCINLTTNRVSAIVTTAEASYTHPISAISAPVVSAAVATKSYSWTSAACPSGTTKGFQYRTRASTTTSGTYSYGSWTASTASSATNSAATSQGVNYALEVQARCTNANTASPWSGTGSASFNAPVVHVELRYWAIKMTGKEGDGYAYVRHKTFSAACTSPLVRESKLRMSWNSPGKNTYVDASPWFAVASNNIERKLVDDVWDGWISYGEMVEVAQYTRCRNTVTGHATNAAGNTSLRNPYDIGNLYMTQDGTKYKISCAPNSMQIYCAGGHSAGGTLTNSNLTGCALRAAGNIADVTQRYTALIPLGSNSPCW